jgi:hypothetical protein
MDVLSVIGSAILGFFGGAAALWAQHRILWKPQKRIELRRAIFDEAVKALAHYEVDALDVDLQDANRIREGERLAVEIRLETRVLMQRTRLQVEAFFPTSTSDAYKAALHAPIGIRHNPVKMGHHFLVRHRPRRGGMGQLPTRAQPAALRWHARPIQFPSR